MRSTAPAAVAASISCSRARLVALRRQVRAVPAVHMTIGRISATQSSRFRSAPRCRSPQHARRREVSESVDQADNERPEGPDCATRNEPASRAAPCRRPYRPGCRAESPDPLTRARAHADAVRENAPGCHQPIVVHRRWLHTRTGRRRQQQRLHGSRRNAAPASRSTIEHLGRRSRSISPVQAEVGVTRLMTAGGAATSRVRPAFNPTVGGVTGTSPRYGNRNRRRTSRHSRR